MGTNVINDTSRNGESEISTNDVRKGTNISIRKNTTASMNQYKLQGLCYVTEKGFCDILNIKDEVQKNLKKYPIGSTTDIEWAKIFVMYITNEPKDIDLRL